MNVASWWWYRGTLLGSFFVCPWASVMAAERMMMVLGRRRSVLNTPTGDQRSEAKDGGHITRKGRGRTRCHIVDPPST